ncbi:MAG: hypothetical protein S4CHLAM20_07750 [Chlamydiia bacterium]|nr:hypothetical protein [Chlamydiia bacterium]
MNKKDIDLTKNEKEYILNNLLENICEISNKDYQKRIWIRSEGPYIGDFDEFCMEFFDYADGVIEDYKSYGITVTQYENLLKLHDVFELFSDKHREPEEFIDLPEWQRIMDLAKEVLKVFNYKKSDL